MITIIPQLEKARKASRELLNLNDDEINKILIRLSEAAIENSSMIIGANKKDLARMDKNDPKYDGLLLNEERIKGIAADIKNVATLPTPLGRIMEEATRPNGMKISKVSVPFGVIGVIYEARPNVSFDVFSLCFKAGNTCVLKGGADAEYSNIAIVEVIHSVLKEYSVNPDVCTLLPATREATSELLNAVGYVDWLIPLGCRTRINFF